MKLDWSEKQGHLEKLGGPEIAALGACNSPEPQLRYSPRGPHASLAWHQGVAHASSPVRQSFLSTASILSRLASMRLPSALQATGRKGAQVGRDGLFESRRDRVLQCLGLGIHLAPIDSKHAVEKKLHQTMPRKCSLCRP